MNTYAKKQHLFSKIQDPISISEFWIHRKFSILYFGHNNTQKTLKKIKQLRQKTKLKLAKVCSTLKIIYVSKQIND